MRNTGMESVSTTSTGGRTAAWSAALTPAAKVAMEGTRAIGSGVGLGVGSGVGAGVGSGGGAGVGSGVGAGVGSGVVLGAGSTAGAGVGSAARTTAGPREPETRRTDRPKARTGATSRGGREGDGFRTGVGGHWGQYPPTPDRPPGVERTRPR